MWPWGKTAISADSRIKQLCDDQDTLKRQVRSLELEWESTYNKLRAIVARLNKREERAIDEVAPATPGEALPVDNHVGSRAAVGSLRIPRRNY